MKKELPSTDSKVINTANGFRDAAVYGDKVNLSEGSNEAAPFSNSTVNSSGFVGPVSSAIVGDVHVPVSAKGFSVIICSLGSS